MTAHIFYGYFLDAEGRYLTIGGIQTYITNLSELLKEMGHDVIVYQQGDIDFVKNWDGIKVVGVKGHSDRGYVIGQRLFDRCKKDVDKSHDIIIFGTDTLNIPCPGYKTISIQHGIYWDVPQKGRLSSIAFFKEFLRKAYKAWKEIRRVSIVDCLVCVDYNFINWYRSIVAYPQAYLKAIMNFTDIPEVESIKKPKEKINIIFARRLVEYRGTRLFAEAIAKLLPNYPNVCVTIAGSGPDEEWLKKRLKEFSNVIFTYYASDESLKIHGDKHIAVVPTVGSEGTSLSLLEAMACGCAVICTNVGGMTNIVQNGYNGIIIEPSVGSLYAAFNYLLHDIKRIDAIGVAARQTVQCSFSKDRWRNEWRDVIDYVQSN